MPSPPLQPNHSRSRPAFLPLSVRSSTLYPFDFDPAEAMAELESKVSSSRPPHLARCRSEGTAGDSPALAKKMRPTVAVSSATLDASPEASASSTSATSSNAQTGPARREAEWVSFSTPVGAKSVSRAFSDPCTPSAASVRPSKNNLASLLKELDSPRSKNKAKCTTPTTVHVPVPVLAASLAAKATSTSPSSIYSATSTPQKRRNLIPSPSGTFRSILSPRTFSATDLFSGRKRSTSQDEHDGNEIVGDLEFLCSRPPPDLSQHPSMAADPFRSKSSAPNMSTHMTVSQARDWAKDLYRSKKQRWMENQTRPFVKGEPFPTFKQPKWISNGEEEEEEEEEEELKPVQTALAAGNNASPPPGYEKQDLTTISQAQVSPMPRNPKMPKTPLRIDTKAANSPSASLQAGGRTPAVTPLTDDVSKKSESASARSFSNLFKSRSGADRSSASSVYQEKPSPQEKKEHSRAAKERYLRIRTNCPSFDYSPTSVYPRHPNTGRDWRSRNLRCAGCQWVTCGVCGRACCARAACFYAIENHKENPESLARAQELKSMIEYLMPTDSEVQTFLTCTSCKKEICPDCCGICPNQVCQDIQCRYCKRGDPWDECHWHKTETIRQELVNFGIRPRSSVSI